MRTSKKRTISLQKMKEVKLYCPYAGSPLFGGSTVDLCDSNNTLPKICTSVE